jgi:hypothetical protein
MDTLPFADAQAQRSRSLRRLVLLAIAIGLLACGGAPGGSGARSDGGIPDASVSFCTASVTGDTQSGVGSIQMAVCAGSIKANGNVLDPSNYLPVLETIESSGNGTRVFLSVISFEVLEQNSQVQGPEVQLFATDAGTIPNGGPMIGSAVVYAPDIPGSADRRWIAGGVLFADGGVHEGTVGTYDVEITSRSPTDLALCQAGLGSSSVPAGCNIVHGAITANLVGCPSCSQSQYLGKGTVTVNISF